MALKAEQPILAGTSLARVAIQSPNYVPGVSGWCVFQNGDVEFNEGTFRGAIIGGSLFIYDPSPGAGNLIGSITDQTTDPYGDTTQKGINSYAVVSGETYAVGLNQTGGPGYPGLSVQDIAHPPYAPPGLFAIGTDGVAHLATAVLESGQVTSGDTTAALSVSSATTSGITNGAADAQVGEFIQGYDSTLIVDDNNGLLNLANPLGSAPSAPAVGPGLYANTNGTPSAVLPSGRTGQLRIEVMDLSSHTVGNVTSPAQLTSNRSVPANDIALGTEYIIETPVTGTWEGEILNLGLWLDGATFKNLVPVAAAAFTSTHGIVGTIRLHLLCTTAGSSGQVTLWIDGALQDSNVDRSASTSVALEGLAASYSLDTTAAHTLAIGGDWGGSAAGQSITSPFSRLTRSGA